MPLSLAFSLRPKGPGPPAICYSRARELAVQPGRLSQNDTLSQDDTAGQGCGEKHHTPGDCQV